MCPVTVGKSGISGIPVNDAPAPRRGGADPGGGGIPPLTGGVPVLDGGNDAVPVGGGTEDGGRVGGADEGLLGGSIAFLDCEAAGTAWRPGGGGGGGGAFPASGSWLNY